jgi:beta-mannosidase
MNQGAGKLEHHGSISLEGNDWTVGYKKMYDDSAPGTIAEADKMSEWLPATVPGNVRADLMAAGRLPALFFGQNNERAAWVNDCVWWYKKEFPRPRQEYKRLFLELRGVDYLSQVYLNGRKLGENEGMFTRQLYDVSSIIRANNTLSVRIMGSSFLRKRSRGGWQRAWEKVGTRLQSGEALYPDRTATLKCQMSFGWDFAPDIRTMGVWDEVNLIATGNVSIGRVDVRPSVYRELDSAKMQVRLYLNSLVAAPLTIQVQLRPANFEGVTHSFSFNAFVKKGIEVIERNVMLKNPVLWYPWDKGSPNLYEMNISLHVDGVQTDSMSGLVGLRDIQMQRNPSSSDGDFDWTFVVNGDRTFIRGANWVPVDSLMGRVRQEDYVELIRMAKEAHVNMFRVWGGGLREKRYFYELCSREGILVWQEFPFACVFLGRFPADETFLKLAEKEVASIVKSVAHHPCVALYCGGNEFSPSRNAKLISRVSATVREIDPTRPFIPSSPSRGDTHNWLIWHGFGNIRDYRDDTSRFASEFGLQAVPSEDSLKRFLPERALWPPGPEWEYHKADLSKLERYVGPPSDFSRVEDYVETSQRMQAFALQTAIEHFRRRKYDCSGAIFWQFNEPWPAISWSVIDYYRKPKLAYHRLKEVFSPVLVSLKYELTKHEAGEVLPIEGWIINDFPHALENCMVDVFMEDEGRQIMRLGFDVGTIPPDSCQTCFEFGLKLPNRPRRLLRTALRSGDRILNTNTYDLDMWDPGEATPANRLYDRAGKWVMSR